MNRAGVLTAAVLLSAGVALPPLAMAGSYDALCNGVDCRLNLDGKGFSGPAGFIPAHRIAQWYTGGGEEHNQVTSVVGATGGAVGGAVVGAIATCWTIILCPLGLIGGGVAGGMGGSNAGKTADFYFTIIGYNQQGSKVVQSFNFLNKKPAGRMMQELPAISGLGMGEMRSVEQIQENDARAAESGSGRPQLPQTLGPGPAQAQPKVLPEALPAPAAPAARVRP